MMVYGQWLFAITGNLFLKLSACVTSNLELQTSNLELPLNAIGTFLSIGV